MPYIRNSSDLENWMEEHNFKKIKHENILIAFTHPSYKGLCPEVEDYERIEFLGDSVLDLILAEELLETSKESEGVLTELRKQKVNNDYLAKIFDTLGMERFLRAAINYKISIKDKANVVEAFFGANFMEHRYEYCKELWDIVQQKMEKKEEKKLQEPLSRKEKENRDEYITFYKEMGLALKNAKSMLQELCQKQGLEIPKYFLVEKVGPDHDPKFRVKVTGVFFNKNPQMNIDAIGVATNKKLAEIKAAEKLCEKIFLNYIPS